VFDPPAPATDSSRPAEAAPVEARPAEAAPAKARNGLWERWWVPVLAVLVLAAVVLGYGLLGAHRIEVKPYTITSPEIPAEFDGTRIILLTDIHRTWFFSQDRVRSLVERVNALKPDLVLLGGDYVFAETEYAASCFEELAGLQAPLGSYAVLGNHDYGEHDSDGEDPTPVVEAIQEADITLLDNQGVWIEQAGAQIRLGGVSDYSMGWPQLGPVIEGTNADDFVILVSHNPDYAEELPPGAVDLTLSGHTHGGQITFFGLWAPFVPSDYGQKYRTGLVATENTTVIVSNGIGTIFPPIRFFAPAQIVEITLESGPSPD
jgi:predicted MPP superfamily phosphohydrolase